MEIKELDKKQYILLTLLITFVVSIATGIVTVSLMNQAPKSVPQTINNVIQRTIEKVTTVQVPAPITEDKKVTDDKTDTENNLSLFDNNDALVSIYKNNINPADIIPDLILNNTDTTSTQDEVIKPVALGQGVIISDIGLILVDSSILNEDTLYRVVLDKKDFNASILKKFSNGFTILKISAITNDTEDTPLDTEENTDTNTENSL